MAKKKEPADEAKQPPQQDQENWEQEADRQYGAPSTPKKLLTAEQREGLAYGPADVEDIATNAAEGAQKYPGFFEVGGVQVEQLPKKVANSRQMQRTEREAYWAWREARDQRLLNDSDLWKEILTMWDLVTSAARRNPGIMADFAELERHMKRHGQKVREGVRQKKQQDTPPDKPQE